VPSKLAIMKSKESRHKGLGFRHQALGSR
jgi:hypothetical protein